MIIALPHYVIDNILHEWLTVTDICRLDTTVSLNLQTRGLLNPVFKSPKAFWYSACTTRINLPCYRNWVLLRHIEVETLVLASTAQKELLKSIPALRDVTGSADRNQTHDQPTLEVRGVYNYNANSMQAIMDSMGIARSGRDVRLLDIGCGNSIFTAIFQMCYPEAKVMGIDSLPIINTLHSIQEHCRRPLYQNLTFRSLNTTSTTALNACITAYNPTHAVCFSALPGEEEAFLSAVQSTPSVVCIALAERRGRNAQPDFSKIGFVQTHRLAVQNAGTRKLRHVLIARRASRS